MGNQIGTKVLSNGKLSFKLDPATIEIVILATMQRMEFDDLPEYLYYLLKETIEKMIRAGQGRISLRKSEFFALFDPAIANYLDEPTQMILKQAISFKEIPHIVRPLNS